MDGSVEGSTSPFIVEENEDTLRRLKDNFENRTSIQRKAPYWAFFRTTEILEDQSKSERVQCIVCEGETQGEYWSSPSVFASSGRLKGSFLYSSLLGTSNLSRHVKLQHSELLKTLESCLVDSSTSSSNQVDLDHMSSMPGVEEVIDMRKRKPSNDTYLEKAPKQMRFLEDIVLLITHGLMPVSLVENDYFQWLIVNLDPRIHQPSRKAVVNKLIPLMKEKIEKKLVFPLLKTTRAGVITFDLWMSRGGNDIFSIVYHSIDQNWKYRMTNLGLMESLQSDGASICEGLQEKLREHGLQNKILGCVKDQGSNLNTCTRILAQQTSNSFTQGLLFEGHCLAHAVSKVCANCMKVDKIIPSSRNQLQKCITYTRKSAKGKQLLETAQKEKNLPLKKLVAAVKTRFGSMLAMFKSCLDNEVAILHLFTSLVSQKYRSYLPSPLTWQVAKVTYLTLKRVMGALFTNQRNGILLSTALTQLIDLYVSFHSDLPDVSAYLEGLQSDGIECETEETNFAKLLVLSNQLKDAVIIGLEEFLQPFMSFNEQQGHMWLALMLDPFRKKLRVLKKLERLNPDKFPISSLILRYEDELLFPLLQNSLLIAHPCAGHIDDGDSEEDFDHYANQSVQRDRSLMLVKDEYLRFRSTVVNNESSNALEWYSKNGSMFPVVSLFARQILSFPSSQSENERVFSLSGLLTNNRRNRTSIPLLDSIVRINKNLGCVSDLDDVQTFLDKEIELFQNCDEDIDDADFEELHV